MPAKNTLRYYVENGYYHVYNRGVDKRTIFLDEQDYKIFLYYLFVYLADPIVIKKFYPGLKVNLLENNLHERVLLHTYCLMPNHFHFLLQQRDIDAISHLMKCLTNAYTRYFNEKYDRVGPLFQGVYKAAPIETDEYLLQVSRYIHRNSLVLEGFTEVSKLAAYPGSSLQYYVGEKKSSILTTKMIAGYFSKRNPRLSYESFVKQQDDMQLPESLLIETE